MVNKTRSSLDANTVVNNNYYARVLA